MAVGLNSKCPLCERPLEEINIDQHHLIPKSRRGKDKDYIYRICHRKIHATFTDKELEKFYHTWERLRENQEIQKFIKWVDNKDPGFYDGSKETTTRKEKHKR
jgi:hypothetical protein